MAFQIEALPLDEFAPLFAMDDAGLAERGAKWFVADRKPGFPCRVSLQDADPGERLLLVPYEHQPARSPYRASGPVFVRAQARPVSLGVNEVPEQLRLRPLSIRAYDAGSLMIAADIVDGRELETLVDRMFGNPAVSYLHVHFAKPGCYACRIDRR